MGNPLCGWKTITFNGLISDVMDFFTCGGLRASEGHAEPAEEVCPGDAERAAAAHHTKPPEAPCSRVFGVVALAVLDRHHPLRSRSALLVQSCKARSQLAIFLLSGSTEQQN